MKHSARLALGLGSPLAGRTARQVSVESGGRPIADEPLVRREPGWYTGGEKQKNATVRRRHVVVQAVEGLPAGEHEVQDAAARPDVRACRGT